MNQKVVALIWPGGWGKSTIGELLMKKYDLPKPTNYTTRAQRNEKDLDYTFVSDLEFAQKLKAKELMNCVVFNGNLYGFHKDTFNAPHVLLPAIVPESIIQIHKYILEQKWKLLTIFFELSEEECIQRMISRGDPMEIIEKRIQEDKIVNLYGPKLADITIKTNKHVGEVFAKTEPVVINFLAA